MAARVSLLAVALGMLLCLLTTTVSSTSAASAAPAGAAANHTAKDTPLADLLLAYDMPVGPHMVHTFSTVLQMWVAIDYVTFDAAPHVARELATQLSRYISHLWRPQTLNPAQLSFVKDSMKEMLSMTIGACVASTPARPARRAAAREEATIERRHLPCFKQYRQCTNLKKATACYQCLRTCLRVDKDANGCGRLHRDPAMMMQACVWHLTRMKA